MSDEVQRYLEEVLALDPREHAASVIALRAAHLQRRTATGDVPATTKRAKAERAATPSREALDAALTALGEALFERDEAQVRGALAALPLESHPDLERQRRRLAAVNELRSELDALGAKPGAPSQLVRVLRDVLSSRGAEAAARRDSAVRSHAKGRAAAGAKRFAKLVRRSYPALAALEPEWLERLERAKRDAKDSLAVRGGIGFIGGYFLISGLIKLIGMVVAWIQGE